jgi:hypothetical protein
LFRKFSDSGGVLEGLRPYLTLDSLGAGPADNREQLVESSLMMLGGWGPGAGCWG